MPKPKGYDQRVVDGIKWEGIHEPLRSGLERYVTEGGPVGDFLTAVLENNLAQAIFRADGENIKKLPDIVRWVYWNLPAPCWGSSEKVDAWLEGFYMKDGVFVGKEN